MTGIQFVLAVCGGILIGIGLTYIRVRSGLTREDWYWLGEIYDQIRSGEYDFLGYVDDDEKGE